MTTTWNPSDEGLRQMTDPQVQPSTAGAGPDDGKAMFQEKAREKIASGDSVESEVQLWEGGYSPKAMIGTWILAAVLTIVALVICGMLSGSVSYIWTIGGIGILAGWVWAGGAYLVRRWGVHYILTTQRFIHQHGLLVRTTDRIEVIDIDDVAFSQGPVQRMLGVGIITLTGSDRTHPELKLLGIDNVKDIAAKIDDTRRQERRKRSLHIQSM